MKQKISRRFQLMIICISGFMGMVPAAFCRHGQCASCFGCAGIGLLAAGMGLWNKFKKIRTHRRTVVS